MQNRKAQQQISVSKTAYCYFCCLYTMPRGILHEELLRLIENGLALAIGTMNRNARDIWSEIIVVNKSLLLVLRDRISNKTSDKIANENSIRLQLPCSLQLQLLLPPCVLCVVQT